MSTTIFGSDDEHQTIKRFWGGKEDGVCFKVKLDLILTKSEYLDLLDKMYKGIDKK